MAVIFTTTVNGVTFGFDWDDQEIEIDAGTDILEAADLKTAIKLAEEDQESGIVFETVAVFGNPVTLTASASTFLNVILQDQWRILTLKTSGTFTVQDGNVVNVNNGIDIFATNNNVATINNISAAGVLVESGVSGLTASEAADLLLIKRILANGSTTVDNGDGSCTVTLYDTDDDSGAVVGVWDVSDTERERTT